MALYSSVVIVFVSNAKANIPGEKWMRQSLGIHFSPRMLAFTLETQNLPINVYIIVFEANKSFGDVFAVTPFNIEPI